MEKRAICDWLSSTCEIEELRFPVLSIYDFCLFSVCFTKFREPFLSFLFVIGIVLVPLFGEAYLIYLCVGYYLNCFPSSKLYSDIF